MAERFWAKVDRSGGPGACWPWTGLLGTTGYGQFNSERGVTRKAHRVAFVLAGGTIPEGLSLDHLCRNTICVNPAHLEPVTHLENVRRGNAGWNMRAKTHCPKGHEYTPDNIYRLPSRPNARYCRECHRASGGRVQKVPVDFGTQKVA